MGSIEALWVNVSSGSPAIRVESVRMVDGYGIEGDRSSKPGSLRQVLIVSGEVLDSFGLEAGQIKENITVRGLDVDSLPRGTRLQVGEAVLETTLACTPCGLLDDIRPGLREEIRGQRGMLCRVLQGGTVRKGDRIAIRNDQG
jgi:MOSC domain-containing protein YiiM